MTKTAARKPRFCSDCGAQLNTDALFCHRCGSAVDGRASAAPSAAPQPARGAQWWVVPGLAVFALAILVVAQWDSRTSTPEGAPAALAGGAGAVDISSMTPEDRADRLFNRVMRYESEGMKDSAAFFAPMALASIEALAPLDVHRRYDLGLVALAAGDNARAKAQADTILIQRPTHLLGLMLASRAADARGDVAAGRKYARQLLTAEATERARSLQEYIDHETDIRTALDQARKR